MNADDNPGEPERERRSPFAVEHVAKTLFRQASACLCILDPELRFVAVNEAYARNYKLRIEDFPGRRYQDVLAVDERLNPSGFALFDLLKSSRTPVEIRAHPYEFADQPERGTTFWDWAVHPLLDSQGTLEYVFFSSVEVTARVNAERAGRESEERYRALIDYASDAIFVADAANRYLDVNEAACSIAGYRRDELLALAIPDVVPPDLNPGQRERLETLHEGRTILSERILRRRDGTKVPVEISGRRLPDGRFIAIVRDITERRAAEAEQAKLAAAVQQASDSILVATPDGTITYVNPAFSTITGHRAQDAVGRLVHELLASDVDDPNEVAARRAARARGEPWSGRIVQRRPDGTTVELDLVISPIRDSSGDLIGAADVGRDVTHERALEAQLRQAQKMEAIGRLAGGVAHDFNNLLAAIRGHAELALAAGGPGSEERDSLQEILRAADRAKLITQRLLTFSRLQPDSSSIADLGDTLRGLEPTLRQVVDEQTRLRVDPGIDTARVRIDQSLVEQALLNLVINARDAMASTIDVRAGVELVDATHRAALAGLEPGTYGLLSVADTGEGIAPEHLSLLFEPFFTTKPPGRGTGLGLAIVYSAVTAAGGRVLVDSRVGAGSRFDLLFPLTEAPRRAPEHPPPIVGPRPEDTPTGTESIILVEDEPAVRTFVARLLRKAHYNVRDLGSAEEALAFVQAGPPPSLLISDISMPGMNGPELARRLRARAPGVRILFISGYDPERLESEGRIDRGIATLAKPFSSDELLRIVRTTLDAPSGWNVEPG